MSTIVPYYRNVQQLFNAEQQERRKLVLALAHRIWSPDRLRGYLV